MKDKCHDPNADTCAKKPVNNKYGTVMSSYGPDFLQILFYAHFFSSCSI